MNIVEITEEQGRALREESYVIEPEPVDIGGHRYLYVDTEENVEDHRWADTDLLVYKRDDGKLFGMKWDNGSTESQESGFIYNQPRLVEVVAKEITTVTYEVVKGETV